MSPSHSQSALGQSDADELVEEIESDTRNITSPDQQSISHSVMSNGVSQSSSRSRPTSAAKLSGSGSAVPFQSTLMSRSSTVRSSLSSRKSSIASEQRQRILAKLGPFLNLSDLSKPDLSKPRPSLLNQPPRKLRLHGPVLQVVNSTSVKDRYLFLFNDILVITKPIIEFESHLSEDGERIPKLPITLKHSFLAKSVVQLPKLQCVIPRLDTTAINGHIALQDPSSLTGDLEKMSQVLIQQFIDHFVVDPQQTVHEIVKRGLVKDDPASIAKLLFLTPELDKKQMGHYLSRPANVKVLKSYLDRFKFHHCRIDDALRVFMLSIRLPNDVEAVEFLLATFASQWSASNEAIGMPQPLALRLVKALFGLNDALHTSLYDSTKYVTSAFAIPSGVADNVAQFVEAFKTKKDYQAKRSESQDCAQEKLITEEKLEILLQKVYMSVQRDKIVQAKGMDDDTEPIQITNSIAEADPEGGGASGSLPNRLTYQIASGLITLKIPERDPHFGIKLFSTGLKFEPPFLSFTKSNTCSFRILGRSLGLCNMTFIKIGSRASKYVGLPLAKAVLVERAFMKDTLQISFMNHLQTTRKYLFSFDDVSHRQEFVELVIHAQQQLQQQSPTPGNPGRAVAEAAAMQVLRDTLIPNEDFMPLVANPHTHTTITLKPSSTKPNTPSSSTAAGPTGSSGNSSKPHRIRSNSLSETYIFGSGAAEKALQAAIVNKRQVAQALHIKKKQQKLLQLQLRQNIEGGRAGLNPYSITHREATLGKGNEEAELMGNGTAGSHPHHPHAHHRHQKDEVELYQEKFWKAGEDLVTMCQQNR